MTESVTLERLMTRKELSKATGLSVPTLDRLHYLGTGPACVMLTERRRAYRPSDVQAWINERIKRPTATPLTA